MPGNYYRPRVHTHCVSFALARTNHETHRVPPAGDTRAGTNARPAGRRDYFHERHEKHVFRPVQWRNLSNHYLSNLLYSTSSKLEVSVFVPKLNHGERKIGVSKSVHSLPDGAALNGIPQLAHVKYYTQRATAGVSLITEGATISPVAAGFPHCPGIYLNEHIDAWKKVVDAVHEKDCLIFCQLWHVGRASNPGLYESFSFSSKQREPMLNEAWCQNRVAFRNEDMQVPQEGSPARIYICKSDVSERILNF